MLPAFPRLSTLCTQVVSHVTASVPNISPTLGLPVLLPVPTQHLMHPSTIALSIVWLWGHDPNIINITHIIIPQCKKILEGRDHVVFTISEPPACDSVRPEIRLQEMFTELN